MRETLPSDRVQLRSQSELRDPGSCALCGSGNCDEGYVDTGVWIEYHGNVYFCLNCMRQIVGTIRALTPEEAQELIDQSNAVLAEVTELRKEVEELREYKSNVDSLLSGLVVSADPSDLDVNSDPDEVNRVPDGTNDGPPSGSTDGESTPKKSGSGRRSVRTKPAESGDSSESPKFDL